MSPKWISISDAAAYYGVSEKTIRRWIGGGQLTAERVGPRLIRVDIESLAEMRRPLGVTA